MRLIFTLLFVSIWGLLLGQSTDKNKDKKFHIGIKFSPDYSYRYLSSNSEVNMGNSIIDWRNEYETARMGSTSGVVAKYLLSKRIGLESGLQFSDTGYRSKYFKDDYEQPGGINPSDDPAIPEKMTTNYHYYYLGIPIKLNYYLIRKKVHIFVTTGVSTDFFLDANKKSELEFEDRVEVQTYRYEENNFNNVSFIGLVGLGMEYKISQRFQLQFEPVIRYSFTPLDNTPLKEYLYSFGTNLTLFYH